MKFIADDGSGREITGEMAGMVANSLLFWLNTARGSNSYSWCADVVEAKRIVDMVNNYEPPVPVCGKQMNIPGLPYLRNESYLQWEWGKDVREVPTCREPAGHEGRCIPDIGDNCWR